MYEFLTLVAAIVAGNIATSFLGYMLFDWDWIHWKDQDDAPKA